MLGIDAQDIVPTKLFTLKLLSPVLNLYCTNVLLIVA